MSTQRYIGYIKQGRNLYPVGVFNDLDVAEIAAASSCTSTHDGHTTQMITCYDSLYEFQQASIVRNAEASLGRLYDGERDIIQKYIDSLKAQIVELQTQQVQTQEGKENEISSDSLNSLSIVDDSR